MIVILFFNWYGYRIITSVMEKDADQQLERRLDNNQYDESQLIEIRVALNVPYQTSQSEFERHYGEMEVNGKYYTYVKRKIDNGFLVLKCIPNSSKEMIKAAGNDFFKMANGIDQNQPDSKKQGNNNSLAKNFWSEYDDKETDFDIALLSHAINKEFLQNSSSLYTISQSTPAQPPEACSIVA